MLQRSQWQPLLLIFTMMLLAQLLGPPILRFDPQLIQGGQSWRFFTAHWVHANWTHFGMNMAGFLLCFLLTGVEWSIWNWLWRILVISTGISLALLLWHPHLGWYVGFSGVLYGLYVLAAVARWRQQPWMSLIIIGFVLIKIALEQGGSVKISTSGLIGVPVLFDAHLYGIVIALLLLLVQVIMIYLRKLK